MTTTEQPIKSLYTMNADIFTDAEVLAIFNKAMNELSLEEKEAKKRNKMRKAKADFCNLKSQEVIFIEA